MTNYAKLDHKNHCIVMDRTFAKNAEIIGSPEYDLLQESRKNYPKYAVIERKIKRKEGQNRYRGLTFDAMRQYIIDHEAKAALEYMLARFDAEMADMGCISKGHTYPRVKSWFLKNYPEIKLTGKLIVTRPQQDEETVVSIDTKIPA